MRRSARVATLRPPFVCVRGVAGRSVCARVCTAVHVRAVLRVELKHQRPAVPSRITVLSAPLDAALEALGCEKGIIPVVAELLLEEVEDRLKPSTGEKCLIADDDRQAHDFPVRTTDFGTPR